MAELTPVQVIDTVLTFFATKEIAKNYMPYDIILKSFKLETNDLVMILNKLIKDGYVTSDKISHGSTASLIGYRITFEGLLFCQQGGYGQQIKDRLREATLQSVQTWAIAIGTCALFLIELIKWLVERYGSPS